MAELKSPRLEEKKKLVTELSRKMKSSKTVLIVSTKNLPSSQFHAIKKNLRGKVEIRVAKKSIVLRAIASTEKGAIQNLKHHISADIALFFSDIDTFELSGLLADNQSPTKAKSGEIAPEDISIEPGPTDLIPGPAISELSSVGLKVAVEGGKLAIKQGARVAKKGEAIKDNVAAVLSKLNILPMKVGFIPVAAYDSISDKVYADIKIDKKKTLEELKISIAKALGFAAKIGYLCKETLTYLLAKANTEEKAIENLISKSSASQQQGEN